MKKLLILAAFIGSFLIYSKSAHAGTRAIFPDFVDTATGTVVTLSASAWTELPRYSTRSLIDSVAMWIDHAPGNLNNCLIAITTSALAPGSTSQGWEMKPGDGPWIISLDRRLRVWGIANTAAENLYIQEFR